MKKFILVLVCVLFLTGCSVNYEIDFKENNIEERINAIFNDNIYNNANNVPDDDGFSIEDEIVNEKIPAFKDYSSYYQKDIRLSNNYSYVTLKYDYNYNNIENSYIFDKCFETSYINNDNEYLYVLLSNFICFNNDNISVKLSSVYEVIDDNSDYYKDGYYFWQIKPEDTEKSIEFKLSKKNTNKKNTFLNILRVILIILIGISGGTIFVLKKNEN